MRKFDTRTLTGCALLIAIEVILARFVLPMPKETIRLSIGAVPIFIAGMIYGPIAGGLVGLAGDFIGCMFSSYGFNPIFCVPPILYGVVGGFFNPTYGENCKMWHFFIGYLPPVLFGSILYQSWAMDMVYRTGAIFELSTRSVRFAFIYVIDVLVTYILCRANFLERLKPIKRRDDF